VPAELLAHGRQKLFGEGVILPRPESRVERGRQHVGRHGFFDGRQQRPAAFARVLNEAGVGLEARVFGQRDGRQIQQPRRDDAAATPDLRDVGEIEVVAVIGLDESSSVAQDVETSGTPASGRTRCRCDHLDEVAGA
jgi:hypothetical protein